MSNWQPSNPVERRFMDAHADWLTFAEQPQARLLYWQVNDDDHHLLNTYFQVQEENSCCAMRLYIDFIDGDQYANDITDYLIQFYEQRRENSLAQDIQAYWQAPKKAITSSSTQYLLQVTQSLTEYHPDIFPGFLFVFYPSNLTSFQKMESWLSELLDETEHGKWATKTMRYVMYGDEEFPFSSIQKATPDLVYHLHNRYYCENVAREMVADSNERGDSGKFRRLFVELTETMKNNDRTRLESLSKSALAISNKAGWFDQSVVVHLIAGAAYLSWKDADASLTSYQDALTSAKQAKEANHPAGNKLIVNALFGISSVYLKQNDYQRAAEHYDQIPEYSLADEDYILSVEADRMRAFCWEFADDSDKAIEAAFEGVDAGLLMEEQYRLASSLPVLTHWLYQRINKLSALYDEMSEKFEQLYGKDWKEIVRVDPMRDEMSKEPQA